MPGVIVIGVLLAATVVALVRRPMWGFAGAWFFLILAPTSSIMPIRDLAFEHRMYLPLAAIAAAAVIAIYLLGERLARRLGETEAEQTLTAELLALVLAISAAAILGALTWRRNAQYQTGIAIWQDTVNKRRDNPRAWNNLADAAINAGDYTHVLRYCDEAIRLKPDFPEPYNNRGLWYAKQGQYEEAVDNYSLAIQMRENFPMAYNNRGIAYAEAGRSDEALRDWGKALKLNPDYAEAYYNRGNARANANGRCEAIRDYDEAIRDYDKAIALKPDFTAAYNNRAVALYEMKAYDKAWADVKMSVALGGQPNPEFIKALNQACPRPQGPGPAEHGR
jgi:tetratricopeptide (TPR) repeat protein